MKTKQAMQHKNDKAKSLEKTYKQYLIPMSNDEWKNIRSLEQPSLLRQIQTKTAYSSGDK